MVHRVWYISDVERERIVQSDTIAPDRLKVLLEEHKRYRDCLRDLHEVAERERKKWYGQGVAPGYMQSIIGAALKYIDRAARGDDTVPDYERLRAAVEYGEE